MMMTALAHPLVTDYLMRLRHEAGRLPREQADELLADIQAHLVDALDDQPGDSQVRQVLDRLGSPSELVDAAGGTASGVPPVTTDGNGVRETAAALLLVGSGLIFPAWFLSVPMWLAGMFFLTTARRWNSREKLLGGLSWGTMPLFTIGMALSGLVAFRTSSCEGVGCSPADEGMPVIGIILLIAAVAYLAFVVWATIRLARAARRRPTGI